MTDSLRMIYARQRWMQAARDQALAQLSKVLEAINVTDAKPYEDMTVRQMDVMKRMLLRGYSLDGSETIARANWSDELLEALIFMEYDIVNGWGPRKPVGLLSQLEGEES